MSRDEFAEIFAFLCAAVDKAPNEAQMDVWFDLLGHLPVDALKAGVKQALLDSDYPGMPSVGKIYGLACEIAHRERCRREQEENFARYEAELASLAAGHPHPSLKEMSAERNRESRNGS